MDHWAKLLSHGCTESELLVCQGRETCYGLAPWQMNMEPKMEEGCSGSVEFRGVIAGMPWFTTVRTHLRVVLIFAYTCQVAFLGTTEGGWMLQLGATLIVMSTGYRAVTKLEVPLLRCSRTKCTTVSGKPESLKSVGL